MLGTCGGPSSPLCLALLLTTPLFYPRPLLLQRSSLIASLVQAFEQTSVVLVVVRRNWAAERRRREK